MDDPADRANIEEAPAIGTQMNRMMQEATLAKYIVQYSKNGGRDIPPARFTFKNHLDLDPLQITMHIAVRYVLHRQPSRNIIY